MPNRVRPSPFRRFNSSPAVIADQTRSPWGRRKPWIVVGALICCLAAYFLFRPEQASGSIYFAAWYFALYLGWTLVGIPHTAWVSDMTMSTDQRARLFNWRNLAGNVGGLVFLAIPLLPIWPNNKITPETMRVSAWVVILLIAPVTLAAVTLTPTGSFQAGERVNRCWCCLASSVIAPSDATC